MRLVNLLLLGLMLTSGALADTPYEQQLSAELTKHTVVLRDYYTAADLNFDRDGKLVSSSPVGFGSTDARVYISEIHLKPNRLTILGQRTFPVYDAGSDSYKLTVIGEEIRIAIELPSDKPASEVVPDLLNRIFVRQSELDQ